MSQSDWFADTVERRQSFLSRELPAGFSQEPMTHDMAPRFYHRIHSGGQTFILLESAPDRHPQSLPGHELGDFLKINRLLASQGFAVPEIFAADEAQGLILMQDFGDVSMEQALKKAIPDEVKALYLRATEVLVALRGIPQAALADLPAFDGSRIDQGARRFADWFLPYYYGRRVRDAEIAIFLEMMGTLRKNLPQITDGFVHGDYHPGNLMVLNDGGIGVIDFQGAMRGPSVYDLTNLLRDARRDVDAEGITACQRLYFDNQDDSISDWYKYLSLHFHLRVIGQFIKVALVSGKPTYLQHLPRLWGYLQENTTPAFREYANQAGIDFSRDLPPVDLEALKPLIREDAT